MTIRNRLMNQAVRTDSRSDARSDARSYARSHGVHLEYSKHVGDNKIRNLKPCAPAAILPAATASARRKVVNDVRKSKWAYLIFEEWQLPDESTS